MNFDYNTDMILGLIFLACCALIAVKLIWDIGIPILKILIIFILVYFGVTWFMGNKNKFMIRNEPNQTTITHETTQ